MSTSNKIALLSLIIGIVGVIVAILVAFFPSSEKQISQSVHGSNNSSIINNGGHVSIENKNSIEDEKINQELLQKNPDILITKLIGKDKKILDYEVLKNTGEYDFLILFYKEGDFLIVNSIKFIDGSWKITWSDKFPYENFELIDEANLVGEDNYYVYSGCQKHYCTNSARIFYSIKNDVGYSFLNKLDVNRSDIIIRGEFDKHKDDSINVYKFIHNNFYKNYIFIFGNYEIYDFNKNAEANLLLADNEGYKSILNYPYLFLDIPNMNKAEEYIEHTTGKELNKIHLMLSEIIHNDLDTTNIFSSILNLDNDDQLEWLVVYEKKVFNAGIPECSSQAYVIDDGQSYDLGDLNLQVSCNPDINLYLIERK